MNTIQKYFSESIKIETSSKTRFPIETPRKSEKNAALGLGVICTVNWKNTRKFLMIILPHLGLVTFRFHVGKNRAPVIFITFGFGGRVHDPRHQLQLTFCPPNYSNNSRINPETFSKSIVWETSKFRKSKVVEMLKTPWAEQT